MVRRDDAPELDAEGMPDHGESSDPTEIVPPPSDHPQAVLGHGTTPREERTPEPVEMRAWREEPEDDGIVDLTGDEIGAPVGRLIDDAGSAEEGGIDDEKDVVSMDSGEMGGLSAEEAAMHITDEP